MLWHATFRRADGSETVSADGMDLVLVRDDRVERNEAWFDRVALAAHGVRGPAGVSMAPKQAGRLTHTSTRPYACANVAVVGVTTTPTIMSTWTRRT